MDDRIRLWTEPTPVHPVPRLAEALGLHPDRLLMKRDDLIGWGGGGNKARKLERSLGPGRRARGHDDRHDGCPAEQPRPDDRGRRGHARPRRRARPRGATGSPSAATCCSTRCTARASCGPATRARSRAPPIRRRGARGGGRTRVHRVAFGGSDAHSVQGFVDAGHELREQVGEVDHVVVALGSGGTMAGLVEALGPERVLGVHCGAVARIHGPSSPDSSPSAGPASRPARSGSTRTASDPATPTSPTRRGPRSCSWRGRPGSSSTRPTRPGPRRGSTRPARAGSVGPEDRVVLWHSGGVPGLFGHPQLGA
ncbi:D-cysteine desulfhydrase family protein [Clavibacter zhangzhiyongii]|uniref:D-cysteine desulfhydrase family protein n=1 Tax=Clavibacter zhangzhiyongii TaxID=2768071 RepID=UPI0039E0CAE8